MTFQISDIIFVILNYSCGAIHKPSFQILHLQFACHYEKAQI